VRVNSAQDNSQAIPPLIQLKAVTKSYGGPAGQAVLNRIDLEVGQGEFTAIMGPSGSGKSTLLNLVAGLDRPSSGSITVDGVELAGKSESELAQFRRLRIGFVFQFFHLLNNLNAFDNVLIGAQLAGAAEPVSRVRVQQLLNELGVASKAREYPAKLSGGQRQRVAIARALINRPAVLLADEPTGALDSHTGEQVMDLIAEFNRRGQTILLATHDRELARRYTQRVVELRDGNLISDGSSAPQLQGGPSE
jgi:putative ABC transport system ATP-binding protein